MNDEQAARPIVIANLKSVQASRSHPLPIGKSLLIFNNAVFSGGSDHYFGKVVKLSAQESRRMLFLIFLLDQLTNIKIYSDPSFELS